jgi:transposase-like protein
MRAKRATPETYGSAPQRRAAAKGLRALPGDAARSRPAKKKSESTVEAIVKVGAGTCPRCGGEFFKVAIIKHGRDRWGWSIRCSHCEKDWPGQTDGRL